MVVYLDSNVFDFIAKSEKLKSVAAMLKERRIEVMVSEYHLLEAAAIPNPTFRKDQLKAITTLASKYNDQPLAWRHARELRFELVRCRPKWLHRVPREQKIKRLLRNHRQQWQVATTGAFSLDGIAQYRQDSEEGIRIGRSFQKQIRSEQITQKRPNVLTMHWTSNGQSIDFALSDPEDYWRNEGAVAWFEAITHRHPASRDYADYLAPYLKEDAFSDETYGSLWKTEIAGERMPFNRISGLCSFFQLQARIGHGNAYDALHANFGSVVDGFLTCDKDFDAALRSLKKYLGDGFANIILLKRTASDVQAELETAFDAMRRLN